MGELEEANFEHAVTLTLSDNTTEGTTEGITERTLNVNTISAKEDSKAIRIIYKHLNEVTWEKVEDIDTAYELWEYLKALEELVYKGEDVRLFIVDFENLWNKYVKAVKSVDSLNKEIKQSNKLYYLRNSFKQYYPNIYERLTYAVVKEEDMTVIKQMIELSLNEKKTNNIKNEKNKQKIKHFNPHYDAQPVYRKKCHLCGSIDHLINQYSLRNSFTNWKRTEQVKLKEK
ncbi:hypothetical protein H8356DRAFT_1080979 [Neocallimastix lanati (nom. inval.)]|uniref:Uncharacterized protein n=1 Tax=Neocallimastix californiae TaxID=1754190 RepID=A0A1Y2AS02_9FUNG|nr:hypothetical protein H8356DRAFT_1080979 [Neocallimastix sp. JGI-2020a]ORY25312.1 hypothetical protein LY90DRAFT_514234 [Neocallimastix californiae]|eukprot:ORY25312.1 hypothetical protein LY90DRAFT_514234 [Neocallimastix californiae]